MNSHFSPEVLQIRNASLKRPNFSEIARELNVTPQFVRRVFYGLSTSQRVAKAIEKKMRKKNRSVAA